MSYFNSLTLTTKGQEMLLSSNANIDKKIIFTSASLGSEKLLVEEIKGALQIKNSWIKFPLNSVRIVNDKNTYFLRIEVAFTNIGITENKIMKELGIYAKFENEEEILFAYSTTNDDGETIPKEEIVPATYTFTVDSAISTESKINQSINPEGFITKEILEGFKEAIKNIGFRKIKGVLSKNTNIIQIQEGEFLPLTEKALLHIDGDMYIEGVHYTIENNSIILNNEITFTEDVNYEIIDPLPPTYVKEEMKKFFDEIENFTKEQKAILTDYINEIIETGVPVLNEKFDDVMLVEGNKLVFIANGVEKRQLIIPSGGGGGNGGGSATLMKLVKVNDPINSIYGGELSLIYDFESKLSSGEITDQGAMSLTINNKRVISSRIDQGRNNIEISKYITKGNNNIKISVQDEYSTYRELLYEIEFLEVSVDVILDTTQAYDGNIVLRYIPFGANLEKTIVFKLDGNIIHTEITSIHNRELEIIIPKQPHGVHTLEIYIEATLNEFQTRSSIKTYEIICIDSNNNTPIIAIDSYYKEVKQYENALITYLVYTPNSPISTVELKKNNIFIKNMQVDRRKQVVSIRMDEFGSQSIVIKSGSISRELVIDVSESNINIDAEINGLELFLTSKDRSNSDSNKDIWVSEDTEVIFESFNWLSNGWLLDSKNDSVLRLNGGAKIEIPFQLFKDDIKRSGKTIEIEFSTSLVEDIDKDIITCFDGVIGFRITPQNILFSSALSKLNLFYKEGEKVRASIVIQKNSSDKLIQLYLNGILSNVYQYANEDSFMQSIPEIITVNSDYSQIDIYNIRIYDRDLNQYQILNNYMADMSNVDEKIEIYNKNNIYNSSGSIDYNKVANQMPILTFVGSLPQFKGDKKKCKITYEDWQNPENSFTADNVTNDVQGTSSQYYPRKNYKFKFDKTLGIIMTETLGKQNKYHLRDISIPVDCFCLKADFAESSGTHNTGIAKIIHDTMLNLNILTPPQLEQGKNEEINIRTTIDGFPILVFHQENDISEPIFIGKYNFNNDKSTEEVFGFNTELYPECECIEFLNNNSDRVTFNRSDYDEMKIDEKEELYAAWTEDFEFRFPDDDTLNEAYKKGLKKPENYKRLTDWILSTKNNSEKFKSEASKYFNMDALIFYHCMTEFFGMVDQRAKNMFATTWDGLEWWFIFYDNDTVLGLDNNGIIKFDPGIEYYDKQGDLPIWNDKALSVLWTNVDSTMKTEIQAMYKRIRSAINYKDIIDYLNLEQSDKWCETIYNEDAKFKYIEPLTKGILDQITGEFKKTGEYLERAQGSREEHRKWWLSNRFNYMDSKYNAGDYISDYITMRINVPTVVENQTTPEQIESNTTIEKTLSVVPSDPSFYLVSSYDQYLTAKYENTTVRKRAFKDQITKLESPGEMTFTDTNTIIYGASKLLDLGELASKYPSYISVGKAAKITNLKIGSEIEGYRNPNLRVLYLGNNTMLKSLDIRNCINLDGALDLSGCIQLENFYADNTQITMGIFPEGGNLKNISLPQTVSNITLIGHNSLEILQVESNSNLNTVRIEVTDSSKFDLGELITDLIENNSKLAKLRVTGLKESDSITLETLNKIKNNLIGIDENGYETQYAVLEGTITVVTEDSLDINSFRDIFPNLNLVVTIPKIGWWVDILTDNFYYQFPYENSTDIPSNKIDWGDGTTTLLGQAIAQKIVTKTYEKAGKYLISCISSENILKKITMSQPSYAKTVFNYYFQRSRCIPDSFFVNCTNLPKTITIPSTMVVMKKAFYCISNRITFEKISFAKNMSKLIDLSSSFAYCYIDEVEMPQYTPVLSTIESAFNTVNRLKKIIMPKNVPELTNANDVFSNCLQLEEAVFVEEAPQLKTLLRTFYYCLKLKKTSIPQYVTTLTDVFEECRELEEVIFRGSIPPTISTRCFYNVPTTVKIYVPDEAVEAYKEATNWNKYADNIFGISQKPLGGQYV